MALQSDVKFEEKLTCGFGKFSPGYLESLKLGTLSKVENP